jgi:nitroreductase
MHVLEAIQLRRSVRGYAARAIPDEVLQRLCQAMRAAPSACNLQPWHFVLVTDAELRRQVAHAAQDQTWMAAAPLIVVACGLPDQAYQHMGGSGNSVEIDVAIALDHLTLAAVAEGLGTCWIGAFHEPQIKRLLDIPATVRVVAMTPLGYPDAPGAQHPLREDERKPLSEIISRNRYVREAT